MRELLLGSSRLNSGLSRLIGLWRLRLHALMLRLIRSELSAILGGLELFDEKADRVSSSEKVGVICVDVGKFDSYQVLDERSQRDQVGAKQLDHEFDDLLPQVRESRERLLSIFFF